MEGMQSLQKEQVPGRFQKPHPHMSRLRKTKAHQAGRQFPLRLNRVLLCEQCELGYF